MTMWIFIACALIVVALVVVFSFWPFVVSVSGDRYIAAKGIVLAIVLVICMSILTGLIYYVLGEPRILANSWLAEPVGDRQLASLMSELEQKIVQDTDSDNVESWLMLARGQMALKNYPKAIESLEEAYDLAGDDVDIMVRLVDAYTMNNKGTVSQNALDILLKAYDIDPVHQSLLWFLATAYEQRSNSDLALNYWRDLERLLDQDDVFKQNIKQRIASLTMTDRFYLITITITAELAAQTDESSTLFVFATAPDGSAMPIAATRLQAGDIPMTIRLDDSHSLVSNRPLSGFTKFVVTARISSSHDPAPSTGNPFGRISLLESDAGSARKLEINQKYDE